MDSIHVKLTDEIMCFIQVSQNHLKAVPNLRSNEKLEYLYLGDNKLQSFYFSDDWRTAVNLKVIHWSCL